MPAVGYCSVVLGLILGADPASRDGFDESEFQACGPCCIYMACVLKGIDADLDSLEGSLELGPRGESSLGDLRELARVSGLHPVAAKVGTDFAARLPSPFLAHVESRDGTRGHYVLVLAITHRGVVYVDPPRIARLDSFEHFRERWTGNVLALADSDLEARSLERSIRYRSWTPFLQAFLVATLCGILWTAGCFAWKAARCGTREQP